MSLFQQKVLDFVCQIPKGKVSTYKKIAEQLETKAYRAIGSALKQNPNLVTVPCHRVIKSDGFLGEYVLGLDKKKELLLQEGVIITNNKIDLEAFGFEFK